MYSFLFKFQIDFLFLFTHNIHQLKYHYAGLLNLYCYSTLTNHDVSRRKKRRLIRRACKQHQKEKNKKRRTREYARVLLFNYYALQPK